MRPALEDTLARGLAARSSNPTAVGGDEDDEPDDEHDDQGDGEGAPARRLDHVVRVPRERPRGGGTRGRAGQVAEATTTGANGHRQPAHGQDLW